MFTGIFDIHGRPKKQMGGGILTAQIEWEFMELVQIYQDLEPMRTLEIGSQLGGTLYWWLGYAPYGATIANIDILQNQDEETAAALPGRWQSWARADVVLHTVIGRSDAPETIARIKEVMPEIDFLFIDALHTYEGAKFDFETYGPLVRSGGIIALHDLITPEFSPHIQVGKLWREIQAAGYKTRELRAGGAFGGIGVVYL